MLGEEGRQAVPTTSTFISQRSLFVAAKVGKGLNALLEWLTSLGGVLTKQASSLISQPLEYTSELVIEEQDEDNQVTFLGNPRLRHQILGRKMV